MNPPYDMQMNQHRICDLPLPIQPDEAATKKYVDSKLNLDKTLLKNNN